MGVKKIQGCLEMYYVFKSSFRYRSMWVNLRGEQIYRIQLERGKGGGIFDIDRKIGFRENIVRWERVLFRFVEIFFG